MKWIIPVCNWIAQASLACLLLWCVIITHSTPFIMR